MQKKICFLVFCALLAVATSFGYCPDRDSLWNRLVFLRDATTLAPTSQLRELLTYEEDIKNCAYRNDSTHAFLLQRIGVAYFRLGDYLKAVQYAKQSINIITSNAQKSSINCKHNISNYYLLYVFYEGLNKVSQKMEALDSLVSISIKFKSVDILCLTALYKKVEYFFDVGDYQRCMNYISMGETVTRQYARGKDSVGYIFYFLSRKVWIQIILKNYDLAKALLVNKADECKRVGAENCLGNIYNQLAEVEIHEINYNKALLYYQQAFKYEQQFGNDLNCKEILSNIGYNIYFQQFNDRANALIYYKKALQYVGKDKSPKKSDSIEAVNIFTNIANLYVQQGLYDSAFNYFRLAFGQIKPGANETDLLHSPLDEFVEGQKMIYLITLLIDKGDAFLKQYKVTKQTAAFREAIRVYRLTDQFLERIRKEQSEFASKLFWRNDTRRLYEHAIDACYLQGDMTDAFYFFERSRAVLLNDQLKEQHWLGEKDILKQTQEKKRILQLQREFDTAEKHSAWYNEIQIELFDRQQELNRLQSQIKTNNPLYYQNNVDTNFIGLPEVRNNILKDHQALLELFVGDSAVYSLLIISGNNYLDKINKNDFDNTANAYISYVSNSQLINSKFPDYVRIANHLYQLVFQNHSLPVGRIIISPDGHRYFPFEALVMNTNASSPVYFLRDHAVSYTYSARYLINDFTTNGSNTTGNFLGVAPVQYPASFSLAPLQGSDLSLNEIGSYFYHKNNLVTVQATKNNFLQQFSNYKIIQLYTHAADSSNNGEPVIYFADSALYLSELIPETKPNTRLIVLSACETGNGKLRKGEGVFSFNRGFASLGIPSSIINLWEVENRSTYQITELFYKYLSEGMPVDIALQKAKLEFMEHASEENRLPFFWAPAIVAGKTEVLIEQGKNKWKYIGFTAMAIVGLSFLGWRKWGNHSN